MSATKKEINGFCYDVWWAKPDEIFQLPRSRAERVRMLKTFFIRRMEDRWMKLPKATATLERQFVKEMFKSIE